MLLFCPSCSNALIVELGSSNVLRFSCVVCPYIYNITETLTSRTYPALKEVDHILGGAEAWKNADSIDEQCPKCQHPRAYFMQIQIRSADEPMTTFYRCCNFDCSHQWRD